MSAWIETPEGHQCTREGHQGETFPRGEVCRFCRLDPGPGIEAYESCGNEHDDELIASEEDLLVDAKFWRREARELWEGMPLERGTAVKAADTGLKYERTRLELRERRAQREHERQLIQHEREMQGLRRGN